VKTRPSSSSTPTRAFVNDDEIEKVRRVFTEVGRRFSVLRGPAHEGLENGEEEARALRDLALLPDVLGLDSRQRVFSERSKRREVVVRLIRERISDRRGTKSAGGANGSPAFLSFRFQRL
jgi:hypothetical protein